MTIVNVQYAVELWDKNDMAPEDVLARTSMIVIAKAAFRQAIVERPGRKIFIRKACHVLADIPEPPRMLLARSCRRKGGMSWKSRLSTQITLNDGRHLRTLKDAGELLTGGEFKAIARNASLEKAVSLLLRAAETNDPKHVHAATAQVRNFLLSQRLVE